MNSNPDDLELNTGVGSDGFHSTSDNDTFGETDPGNDIFNDDGVSLGDDLFRDGGLGLGNNIFDDEGYRRNTVS